MSSPISFIIPALNEEAALTPMLDGLRAALDAAACADTDIVVDNGSRDRTAADANSKISGNFVGTLRAGWKTLWTIGKHGLSPGR